MGRHGKTIAINPDAVVVGSGKPMPLTVRRRSDAPAPRSRVQAASAVASTPDTEASVVMPGGSVAALWTRASALTLATGCFAPPRPKPSPPTPRSRFRGALSPASRPSRVPGEMTDDRGRNLLRISSSRLPLAPRSQHRDMICCSPNRRSPRRETFGDKAEAPPLLATRQAARRRETWVPLCSAAGVCCSTCPASRTPAAPKNHLRSATTSPQTPSRYSRTTRW